MQACFGRAALRSHDHYLRCTWSYLILIALVGTRGHAGSFVGGQLFIPKIIT